MMPTLLSESSALPTLLMLKCVLFLCKVIQFMLQLQFVLWLLFHPFEVFYVLTLLCYHKATIKSSENAHLQFKIRLQLQLLQSLIHPFKVLYVLTLSCFHLATIMSPESAHMQFMSLLQLQLLQLLIHHFKVLYVLTFLQVLVQSQCSLQFRSHSLKVLYVLTFLYYQQVASASQWPCLRSKRPRCMPCRLHRSQCLKLNARPT